MPFTEAPAEARAFADFVRRRTLSNLTTRYPDVDIGSLSALRQIYRQEIDARSSGPWAALSDTAASAREVEFLEEQLEKPEHCDAVLRFLREKGLVVTLVLDNVDQRTNDEQLAVFLLAQELCSALDAVVFVALREDSFFRAEQAGAFNAYHNIRYHIASPDIRQVLRKRLAYALQVSEQGNEALRVALKSGVEFEAPEICAFLHIIKDSVLKQNRAIGSFIDAIAHGNIRSVT